MIDQSHNVEGKIDAMIQSVMNIQTAYAKALLVDEAALAAAQGEGDVLGAHRILLEAYETDVRPLLAPAAGIARRRGRPGRGLPGRGLRRAPGRRARHGARRERLRDDLRPLRIALFVTCIGDAVAPEVGKATVAVLERLGHEVVFPRRADVLRADAHEQRLPAEALALARRFVRGVRRVRDRRLAVVVVRGNGAAPLPGARARAGVRSARASLRAVRAARAPARGHGRRRVVPAPRDLPPDLPLAARDARRRRAASGCSRRVDGLELVPLPRRRGVLRVRRHVRVKNADTSTAMVVDKCAAIASTGATVCTAVDASCLLQIGGRLSREGRRGAGAPPGGDPRGAAEVGR